MTGSAGGATSNETPSIASIAATLRQRHDQADLGRRLAVGAAELDELLAGRKRMDSSQVVVAASLARVKASTLFDLTLNVI